MQNRSIVQIIQEKVAQCLASEFNFTIEPNDVVVNETKKEFDGEYTVVIFPFVKALKMSPPQIGEKLAAALINGSDIFKNSNLVAGFLNLEMSDSAWQTELLRVSQDESFGVFPKNGKKIMIEFSSPNTNKPLHLGHVRNILLGVSSALIYEALGYEVIKTKIINDRGIAICKSMYAWEHYSNGETPESSGIKPDHFVGKYYVKFNEILNEEYSNWQKSDNANALIETKGAQAHREDFFKKYKNNYFNEYSQIGSATKQMLLDWEDNKEETIALWKKMNNWVYAGFDETYAKMGVNFDIIYYESETYKLGRKYVEEFVEKGLFYREEDGSIWIDLEDVNLDKKILLRSDGTSVYMTQDIGTAKQRYEDYGIDSMVYVVADEQNYHFKALFEILKRMGEPYSEALFHLSYGMVELPTGRMKSREGTIVDADDLIAEVISEAENSVKEKGGLEELTDDQKSNIYKQIGLGALKYHMIKVNPKKKMIFDPKESVDMQGQTAPYIQNAFVRFKSIERKLGELKTDIDYSAYTLHPLEKDLIQSISKYPEIVKEAGQQFDPSALANYSYNLAKQFHKFYQELRIITAESEEAKQFRIALGTEVAKVLEKAMGLLGIEMPERM